MLRYRVTVIYTNGCHKSPEKPIRIKILSLLVYEVLEIFANIFEQINDISKNFEIRLINKNLQKFLFRSVRPKNSSHKMKKCIIIISMFYSDNIILNGLAKELKKIDEQL